MNSNFQSLDRWLFRPVPSLSLSLFRILLGALLFVDLYTIYIQGNFIDAGILAPKLLFPYEGLEFIKPLSRTGMYVVLYGITAATVFIMLGFLTRVAALVYFLGHTYILLLDKFVFNNHIYLFSLLAFWFIFLDSDQYVSLRSLVWKRDKSEKTVPYWQIVILAAHFFMAYLYGGFTKTCTEWLVYHEPMRLALINHVKQVSWLGTPLSIHFFTYTGWLFDLVVGFLLVFRRTRWFGVLFVILFNVTNSFLFDDISIFPYVMLSGTLLFFPPEQIAALGNLPKLGKEAVGVTRPWLRNAVLAYLVIQALLPFRYLLLPNPVDWSGVANRYAWRMKCQTRQIYECGFVIKDGLSGEKVKIDVSRLIHTMQIVQLGHDARAAVQMAKYLKRRALELGMLNPVVMARIKVSYNGRPPQYFLDPEKDLARVQYSPFRKMEWLMPLVKHPAEFR